MQKCEHHESYIEPKKSEVFNVQLGSHCLCNQSVIILWLESELGAQSCYRPLQCSQRSEMQFLFQICFPSEYCRLAMLVG